MESSVPQFSTPALRALANGLRRWQAQQAAENSARERTALVLGVEPTHVAQPFEIDEYRFRQAVGAA